MNGEKAVGWGGGEGFLTPPPPRIGVIFISHHHHWPYEKRERREAMEAASSWCGEIFFCQDAAGLQLKCEDGEEKEEEDQEEEEEEELKPHFSLSFSFCSHMAEEVFCILFLHYDVSTFHLLLLLLLQVIAPQFYSFFPLLLRNNELRHQRFEELDWIFRDKFK